MTMTDTNCDVCDIWQDCNACTTPEEPAQTVTFTLTRGRPLITEQDGTVAFTVTSDGPFRARGMLWVERPGQDARVIPAEQYRNLTGA